MEIYGLVKIGVPEIDLDHVNIDKYLGYALEAGFNESAFTNLCSALIGHFEREEQICSEQGLHMSDLHLDEHHRLTNVIKQMVYSDKSEEEWLLFFKRTLLDHVEDFDKSICEIN